MNTLEKKYVEKLEEIFNYLNDRANTLTLNWSYYYDLRNEIDLLEQQVEEQESKDRENLIKLVRIARRGSLCWGGITDEMSWKFDIDSKSAVIDEYLKTK